MSAESDRNLRDLQLERSRTRARLEHVRTLRTMSRIGRYGFGGLTAIDSFIAAREMSGEFAAISLAGVAITAAVHGMYRYYDDAIPSAELDAVNAWRAVDRELGENPMMEG
jgi:hypothetical protein